MRMEFHNALNILRIVTGVLHAQDFLKTLTSRLETEDESLGFCTAGAVCAGSLRATCSAGLLTIAQRVDDIPRRRRNEPYAWRTLSIGDKSLRIP